MTPINTILNRVNSDLGFIRVYTNRVYHIRNENPFEWDINLLYYMVYHYLNNIHAAYRSSYSACSSGMRERKTAMTTQEANCEAYRTAAETAHENYVEAKEAGETELAKQYYEAYVEAHNNFTSTKKEHKKLANEYMTLCDLSTSLSPKCEMSWKRANNEYIRHKEYIQHAIDTNAWRNL